MDANRAAERSTLFVTTLTAFMSPFMFSAVNVALPALQKELSLDAIQMSWVATSYLVAMAISLVPSGKIGDIYGRKKTFVAGTMLFTLASTLAAVAPSFVWFIVLRAAQGIGVAMFSTTAMAILTSVFPLQRRGQALGIYVAAVYIGLSAGPFLGGFLVQYLGWRSIFLTMLPLGLISAILTLHFLRQEWAEARGQRFDLLGSFLYAAAIFAIVFGVTRLPNIQACGIALGGAVLMVGFVIRQQRIGYPVFDVSLFRTNHVFAFSSLAALINYSATSATAFLISLYLQYIKALDAQSAGVVLVSQPIVMALLSPLAGRLADRVQPRLIASAGMTVTALGLAIFARLELTSPLWLIVCNLMLMGVGFSLFSSPNMSAIMGAVEKKSYGIASAALATMRLLGQMMSMAIATVVLSLYMGREAIRPAIYPQFLQSVGVTFTFFAILCLAGVYFSMFRGKLSAKAPEGPIGKGDNG